jgi:hypothetical protein
MDESCIVFTSEMEVSECLETLKQLYRMQDWTVRGHWYTMLDFIKHYLNVSNDRWESEHVAKFPGMLAKLHPHANTTMLKQSVARSTSLQQMHTHLFHPDVRRYYRLQDDQLHAIENEVLGVIQREVEDEDSKAVSDLCHALCAEIFTPYSHLLQSQGALPVSKAEARVSANGKSIDMSFQTHGNPMVYNYISVKPKDTLGRCYEFIMPYNKDFTPVLRFLGKLRELVSKECKDHWLAFKGINSARTPMSIVIVERYLPDELPIPVETLRLVFLKLILLQYGLVPV